MPSTQGACSLKPMLGKKELGAFNSNRIACWKQKENSCRHCLCLAGLARFEPTHTSGTEQTSHKFQLSIVLISGVDDRVTDCRMLQTRCLQHEPCNSADQVIESCTPFVAPFLAHPIRVRKYWQSRLLDDTFCVHCPCSQSASFSRTWQGASPLPHEVQYAAL